LNKFDDGRTKTAFIFNPDLSGLQLLRAIVEDFGIESPGRAKIDIFRNLNKFLIEQLRADNNVILIIDEAQNMKPALLEEVRMLSNLETEAEKLIQIVLVGQPELRDKLRNISLEQLRQRIGVRYHIMPLDEDEIHSYIWHRLKKAGGNETNLFFEQDAISEIYSYSRGTPRLMNVLCDKILLYGFVNNLKRFNGDTVMKSVREIEGIFV
jgi:general secretion pathway protein A